MTTPPFQSAPGLQRLPGIAAGFFGREGGVSEGIYASLNVGIGSGDAPAAIDENRMRVRSALGLSEMESC